MKNENCWGIRLDFVWNEVEVWWLFVHRHASSSFHCICVMILCFPPAPARPACGTCPCLPATPWSIQECVFPSVFVRLLFCWALSHAFGPWFFSYTRPFGLSLGLPWPLSHTFSQCLDGLFYKERLPSVSNPMTQKLENLWVFPCL